MASDANPLGPLQRDCAQCPVNRCTGRLDGPEDEDAWSQAVASRRSLMPGASALFARGDTLDTLYSVRAGCIKTATVDIDGSEHVRGFYLPGDLVGLDTLTDGHCRSSAVAVQPSQLCVIPMPQLHSTLERHPALARRLMMQISRELAIALVLAGDHGAEARLATFLLFMRTRLGSDALHLPMSQRDIGSYLRLANETVCRGLQRFQRRGWIRVRGRDVEILDAAALGVAAGEMAAEASHRGWRFAA